MATSGRLRRGEQFFRINALGMRGPTAERNLITKRCRLTGKTFLIDSGAEVSLAKAEDFDPKESSETRLNCANGTTMQSEGKRRLTIDIGIGMKTHKFEIIKNLKHNIIGMDFLKRHVRTVCPQSKELEELPQQKIIRPKPQSLEGVDHRARQILEKFPSVTDFATMSKTPTHGHKFSMELTDYTPISQRSREPPMAIRPEVIRQLEELLELKVIEKAPKSRWAMPLVYVSKKLEDGKIKTRICCDSRKVNARTRDFQHKTAAVTEPQEYIQGAKVFAKLDLFSAYYALPTDKKASEILVADSPIGRIRWKRAIMGAKTSSAQFGLMMEDCLGDLDKSRILHYVDDIIIASKDEKQHAQDIEDVCKRLQKFNLILNVKKCQFFKDEVTYLGFKINKDGMGPTQEYKASMASFKKPVTNSNLKSLLGSASYIRHTVPGMAQPVSILTKMLTPNGKTKRLKWDAETNKAFQDLKKKIEDAVSVAFIRKNAEMHIMADTSNTHYGAALYQKNGDGAAEPIGFASKVISKPERAWSVIDRELAAVRFACHHWRAYIEGHPKLTIHCDNRSLCLILKEKPLDELTPKQTRYVSYILGFAPKIKHIQGKLNHAADCLSRQTETEQTTPTIKTTKIESTEATTPATKTEESKLITLVIDAPPPVDYNKLAKAQEADREIREIESGKRTSFINVEKRILPSGQIIKGETSPRFGFRVLVPQSFRNKVVKQLHDPCHAGIRKTRSLVADSYIWEGMNADIAKYVRGCERCAKTKIHRRIRTPLQNDFKTPKGRSQVIHLDHSYMENDNGYKYVLIAAYRNSSYFVAIPQKSLTSEETIRAFVEGVVAYTGAPLSIICDNATTFTSDEFRKAMKNLGTEIRYISPYHKQANGKAEERNLYYKRLITALGARRNWRDKLPMLCLYLRNTVNEGNTYSAAEEMYGCKARLPQQLQTNKEDPVSEKDTKYLIERLIQQDKERQEEPKPKSYHKVHVPKAMGKAKMLLIEKPFIKNKFDDKYEGPFLILDKRPKHAIILKKGAARKIPWDQTKIFEPIEEEPEEEAEERKEETKEKTKQETKNKTNKGKKKWTTVEKPVFIANENRNGNEQQVVNRQQEEPQERNEGQANGEGQLRRSSRERRPSQRLIDNIR